MEPSRKFDVIISSRAQKEITTSWEWYEDRRQGLGDRFLKEVLAKVKIIEDSPERFPIRYKNYRETPIAIFPYLIIYRINKRMKSVYIISIFHTSLNPYKK
jgi:plasmid stabilization system protein ParE